MGTLLVECANLVGRALLQLRKVTAAAEQRFNIALLSRGELGLRQKVLHARKALEVFVDERLCLGHGHAGVAGQRERAHAIGDAEVDALGVAALHRRDAVERHVVHHGRSRGVNVLVARKGFLERGIVGQVRQDAQLNLRIVGADQPPARAGDERAPHAPAHFRFDRDVLQIWIGR